MNILLDYLFKVTSIVPTAAASTAFLKQACVVVNPNGGGVAGTIYECTTNAEIAARTDNTEAQQLLSAGLSKVFILCADDLYLAEFLEGHENDFFTLIISSDFTDAEVTATAAVGTITITSYANLISGTDDSISVGGVPFVAQTGAATPGAATFQAVTDNDTTAASLVAQINSHATTSALVLASRVGAVITITSIVDGSEGNLVALAYTDNDTNVGATVSGAFLTGGDGFYAGDFEGVVGVSSTDDAFLATHAAIANRCAFHTTSGNKAKNMCYAFGAMLSNSSGWLNQQYISMPFADDVDTLGAAEALFDDKISFVISDTQYSERLALFACGGKAIVAPYITRNLQIDMQSEALAYISGNQPAYTLKHAALIEDELQKVIQDYIDREEIERGTVEVTLEEENFVASGEINISEPNSLWRISNVMRQTL